MIDKWSLYLRLAWRNVLRHGVRTGRNLFAISLGCAALVIFGGFVHSVTLVRQEQVIHTWTGHLQLVRVGYWEQGIARPEAYLLDDYPQLAASLMQLPHVQTLLPRLGFAGLISNGEANITVRGQGVQPEAEARFASALRFVAGTKLASSDPEGVVLGEGLAQALDVKVGDRVTVMATTLQGAMNAVDLRVRGIFVTGMSEYDRRFFRINLDQSFRLLNTHKVQTVVVGLDDTAAFPVFRTALDRFLAGQGQKMEYRTWEQLYPVLTNGLNWLKAIIAVIRVIILIIVGLSIMNTIAQSIHERVGEIGTVLALGSYKSEVLAQFLLEGGILGVLGGVLGIVASFLIAHFLLAGGILMPPSPSNSQPELVFIDVLPRELAVALGLSLVTALVACITPAWRASRLPIVEALQENV